MSLCPQSTFLIPVETERVARPAFPKGTLCLHIINALGSIFCDPQFASLFPRRGQPAEAPARLVSFPKLNETEHRYLRLAFVPVRQRPIMTGLSGDSSLPVLRAKSCEIITSQFSS